MITEKDLVCCSKPTEQIFHFKDNVSIGEINLLLFFLYGISWNFLGVSQNKDILDHFGY